MRHVLLFDLVLFCGFAVQASDPPDSPMDRPVSLTAKNLPLLECLQQICKQAGTEFEPDYPGLLTIKLDLDAPQTITLKQIPLSQAMSRLIVYRRHPGVFYEYRRGKVVLTTLASRRKRIESLSPDWLKKHLVGLDENDQIKSVHLRRDELKGIDSNKFMSQLAGLPALRELDLGDAKGLTLEGLRALSASTSLTSLTIYGAGHPADKNAPWTSDEALQAICTIKTLQELSANGCGISDAGLEHLASMRQLEKLSLRQNRITNDGLKSLAGLTGLKSLNLGCHVNHSYGRNEITDAGIQHIAGLQQLEYLGIEGLSVTAHTLDFPLLRSLSVGSAFNQQVFDNKSLGNLMKYVQLHSLTVASSTVTDAGLVLVSHVKTLRRVSLNCGSVTDKGLAALAELPLQSLSLRGMKVTDEGLRQIARIKTLSRLELFCGHYGSANNTGFTVTGIQQLKSLPRLRSLWLTGFRTNESYAGFGELKQLQELNFEAADISHLTQKELDRLGEALPDTQIFVGTGAGIYQPSNQQQGFTNSIPIVR